MTPTPTPPSSPAAELAARFRALARPYGADEAATEQCWQELAAAYQGRGRHYHTLAHLHAMLAVVDPFRDGLPAADQDALLLALFYHDAVYRVPGADNEEASAALARRRLSALGVPAPVVARCAAMIEATKRHEPSGDAATDLLLDADLAALGQPWPTYEADYARPVRREYGIYPDFLYNPGRRKVLAAFLERPFLFQTPALRARFEAAARANLTRELHNLS